MSKRRTKELPSERTSITISQINRDVYGNETSSQTYYSTTKHVQHIAECNEPTDNRLQTLDEIDKYTSDKLSSTKNAQRRKSSKSAKKYTQIPLFSPTE